MIKTSEAWFQPPPTRHVVLGALGVVCGRIREMRHPQSAPSLQRARPDSPALRSSRLRSESGPAPLFPSYPVPMPHTPTCSLNRKPCGGERGADSRAFKRPDRQAQDPPTPVGPREPLRLHGNKGRQSARLLPLRRGHSAVSDYVGVDSGGPAGGGQRC